MIWGHAWQECASGGLGSGKSLREGLRWLYRARIFVDYQVEWGEDELNGAYDILSQLIVQLEREKYSQ